MGVCNSSEPSVTEDVIVFTDADTASTCDFIFDAVFKSAVELLTAEMISREQLSPPSDSMMIGLAAVAALNIVSPQLVNAGGIMISNHFVTKNSCPPNFKEVIGALLEMKGHMMKIGDATQEVSQGEINKVKQHLINAASDSGEKSWGSCLQKYEQLIFGANAVARAIARLPESQTQKGEAASKIEDWAHSAPINSTQVVAFSPVKNAFDAEEEDDDGGDANRVVLLPESLRHRSQQQQQQRQQQHADLSVDDMEFEEP
jgi:hypothetical protein